MEDVTIREIHSFEWDEAMRLVFKTFLRFEACDYEQEGVESFLAFISDERLKTLFQIGEFPVLGAFADDKMVGVGAYRNASHISLLFVLEEYQKRGIGKKLLEEIFLCILREHTCPQITVNSSPYAVEFYHKIGFEDESAMCEKDGILYTPMYIKTEQLIPRNNK